MNKKIIYYFFMLISFFNFVNAEIIFKGNKHLGDVFIYSLLQNSDIKTLEDIKNILNKSDFFENVQITTNGKDVIIILKENPIVKNIEIAIENKIVDLENSSKGRFQNSFIIHKGIPFSRPFFQEEIQKNYVHLITALGLNSKYHISPTYKYESDGVSILLNVTKNIIKFRSVKLIGNNAIRSDYIINKMLFNRVGPIGLLSKAILNIGVDTYIPQLLIQEQDKIKSMYNEIGFLDVYVECSPIYDENEVDIQCYINEGVQYKIRSISVDLGDFKLKQKEKNKIYDIVRSSNELNEILIEKNLNHYNNDLQFYLNSTFNKIIINNKKINMKSSYKIINKNDGFVDVVYTIKQDKRSYIQDIEIDINNAHSNLKSKHIYRMLRNHEGMNLYDINKYGHSYSLNQYANINNKNVEFYKDNNDVSNALKLERILTDKKTDQGIQTNLAFAYTFNEGITGSGLLGFKNKLNGGYIKLNASIGKKKVSFSSILESEYFYGYILPNSTSIVINTERNDIKNSPFYKIKNIYLNKDVDFKLSGEGFKKLSLGASLKLSKNSNINLPYIIPILNIQYSDMNLSYYSNVLRTPKSGYYANAETKILLTKGVGVQATGALLYVKPVSDNISLYASLYSGIATRILDKNPIHKDDQSSHGPALINDDILLDQSKLLIPLYAGQQDDQFNGQAYARTSVGFLTESYSLAGIFETNLRANLSYGIYKTIKDNPIGVEKWDKSFIGNKLNFDQHASLSIGTTINIPIVGNINFDVGILSKGMSYPEFGISFSLQSSSRINGASPQYFV